MNERIRRLMLEAGYAAPELAGRAHKLTDLVVRECMMICGAVQGAGEVRNMPEFSSGAGRCKEIIKQDLGV